MGDWYGSRRPWNNEEFQEEDVWSALRDQKGEDLTTVSKQNERATVLSRQLPTAARMIPRAHRERFQEPTKETRMARQSAPVCVPDWSKIYGNHVQRPLHEDEDEDESDKDERVLTMPPHEWMAGRLEKNKKSAFSVCEGAGRTLKGRDLRNVRHAVLTRTGFLEF